MRNSPSGRCRRVPAWLGLDVQKRQGAAVARVIDARLSQVGCADRIAALIGVPDRVVTGDEDRARGGRQGGNRQRRGDQGASEGGNDLHGRLR